MGRVLPVGTRRTRKSGYVFIKTVSGWKQEHIVIWQAIHGPLPEGWCIHHDDEDKGNNAPDNLIACSSNGDHHRTYHAEKMREVGRRVGSSGRGKPKSPEHRAKIAAALSGKTKSPDHRAKLAEGVAKAWQDGKFDGVVMNLKPAREAKRRMQQ